MKRHNLKVIDKKLNVNDIYQKYIENKKLNKSNKILVVCNSIRESINLYEELISLIDETEEVNILHSKFIRKDRAKKECEILRFGRTYDENKNIDKQNGIWISTSIVEASLDIDFDYLFTELRDLNSLFQRLGRCNRKGKKENKDYNCYIYTKIDYVDLINGNVDKVLFDLSKEAIRYFDGKISEKDKINLINTYLTTDNLKESDYLKKYREKYRYINKIKTYEFKKNEENLRDILSEDVIPSPIYIKYIDEIKKIEEGLNSINTSKEEKRKLRNKLMEYTVSVSLWDINNYDRVLLSKYKNDYIKVIECEYGDVGYKSIKYNNETRNSVIWDS